MRHPPPAVTYPLGDERKLFWIDGFLGRAECAAILYELEFAFWTPSTVTHYEPFRHLRSVLSPKRVSETTTETWFTPPLRRTIRSIDHRVQSLVPRFDTRREDWQATRYGIGGKFDYHFDGGHWAGEPAGDRKHTVLLYLDTPRRGGSTHFRELDVEVKPTAGRLIVWCNLARDGDRDPDMLHSATPLAAGRKTVLVTWVRQRDLRTGGVR